MGQRYVELESTYGATPDNNNFLRVAQMPPNPAIMAPGPALLFVVVDGVPSVGLQIMIGSGKLGRQQLFAIESLPDPAMPQRSKDFTASSDGCSPMDYKQHLLATLLTTVVVSVTLVFGNAFGL